MNHAKLKPFEKLAYRIVRLTDIDTHSLRKAVKDFARSVPVKSRILDAGAGLKPYELYFQHCKYESCDFAAVEDFYGNIDDGLRNDLSSRHTYVCPLDNIPVPENTYDFILCTQVLEHVPYPSAVLREFHRILNDSGQLFLTVPQGYGIHGEPFHFFNFTKYGLELVLKDAGFFIIKLQERGGYFYYLFDRLAYAVPRIVMGYPRLRWVMMLVLTPIHIFLTYLLGPLLLLLEPLDREKRFTLGYIAIAKKTN
jgi:SAM-dependent methyltransferase